LLVTRKQLNRLSFLGDKDPDQLLRTATGFASLILGCGWALLYLHLSLWGVESFDPLGTVLVIVSSPLRIWIHEALHYLGFRAAGLPHSALRINLKPPPRALWSGRCEWQGDLSLTGWRVSLLAPLLFLSLLPLVFGFSTGIWWLTVWGATELMGCRGDLLYLWESRSYEDQWITFYTLDEEIPWSEFLEQKEENPGTGRTR